MKIKVDHDRTVAPQQTPADAIIREINGRMDEVRGSAGGG